ncbi:MAG TPA: ABC transporter ATP-binding protein [Bauldia sp.]|nr:ABC transporter ATP-binding protein [Bauldia sp.]
MAAAALRLSDATKSYGQTVALDGLDLLVEEGRFFVIFGPSAVGKTTTLRTISGLVRLDKGSLELFGRDMTQAPIAGRGVSMVFQTFALYPHLTVYNNLAYPLREAKLPSAEIDRRVNEIAELLRIGHVLNRKPATASGGEQQRVALGRSLIQRPRILLLDEPLTNLDAKLRHDMRAEFKRLHREFGITIVYATPDELEALSMGDEIAVMREGRVVQVGSPDDLYDRPKDIYVATKIGAPAMNIIAAKRGHDAAAIELPFGEVRIDPDKSPWAAAAAGAPAGEPFLLGVRPFDVRVSQTAGYPGEVRLVEPLGDLTVVDIHASGAELKMVLPEAQAAGVRHGDKLNFAIDAARAHLFRPDNGAALG